MGKFQSLLKCLDNNNDMIMKILFFIIITKTYISTIYRMHRHINSRTQIETTINIYCLFILAIIFLNEFFKCLMPEIIIDNLKLISNYSGKGIIFLMLSIIYVSPDVGIHQNISGYCLLTMGIICLLADVNWGKKNDKNEKSKLKEVKNNENKNTEINIINNTESNEMEINFNQYTRENQGAKVNNPYEIPEDF